MHLFLVYLLYPYFHFLQIATTVAKIVADAAPELLNDIKLFYINLFQYSTEYVILISIFSSCPTLNTIFLSYGIIMHHNASHVSWKAQYNIFMVVICSLVKV